MFKIIFLFFINTSYAEFKYALSSYFLMAKSQTALSSLNPGNQVFKNPYREYSIDLRADLKWQANDHAVVLRPRFISYDRGIETSLQNETASRQFFDLTDAFYEYRSVDWSVTAGLQVYQWGPAEFLNASNPLYHVSANQKTLIYKEKGQALLRFNYSLDRNNSFVFIAEPVSNNEPEWIEGEKFNAKFLLKYERAVADEAHYFGLAAGVEEKNNSFVGEYFNYAVSDRLSVYADLKQSRDLIHYAPALNSGFYNLQEITDNKNKWSFLGVFGTRWEDNFDFRLEYIYNQSGYTREEMQRARTSAADFTNPEYTQNVKKFLKPGLEILGKNYVYASYRVADPFATREFNLYARYIRSFQDDSAQLQLEFDKSLSDEWVGFASVASVIGATDSEFRLLNDWQALLGLKLSL